MSATDGECTFLDAVSGESGERADVFCAREFHVSRSHAQKLILDGDVLVNGARIKSNARLKAGDTVAMRVKEPVPVALEAQDIPLDIVYEDSDIAVINKPKGMVVHPAPGHSAGTLVNALMYGMNDLSGIGGELRPGIVHRIDKLTSGLIVIAKNDFAHNALSQALKTHSISRRYYALVVGNIKDDNGTIDAPIGRHRRDRKKMAVVEDGRSAVTHYKVIRRFMRYTLLDVELETGRTHQIRVHMAYIHHPVAGDEVYGHSDSLLKLDGQALHAYSLSLSHPRTGENMTFNADMPDYFKDAVAKLERVCV